MNPMLGWALAAAAIAAGWLSYGWQGLVLAASVIVFWLLMQFNRALRVMKNAGQAPVGHVPSAVMLNARLKPGMTMLQLVAMTRSLGRRVDAPGSDGSDESYRWADAGGVELVANFADGRLKDWQLKRPPGAGADPDRPAG